MYTRDPAFWRAGAISVCIVTGAVLIILTIDTLGAISPGGSHVPLYSVINHHISYEYDSERRMYAPVIGGEELLFNRKYTEAEAAELIGKGKLVIQSRACMDCHTFFGNGAYYAPDLTKAWLDPLWMTYPPQRRADAIAGFLMKPLHFGFHQMPNLHIDHEEAQAAVAYLKWMSAVDTNGFPDCQGRSPAK